MVNDLDFYGCTLVDIHMKPDVKSGGNVIVTLKDDYDDSVSTVEFLGCSNVSVHLDFDLLSDCWPSQVGSFLTCSPIDGLGMISSNDTNVEDILDPDSFYNEKLEITKDKKGFILNFFDGQLIVISSRFYIK